MFYISCQAEQPEYSNPTPKDTTTMQGFTGMLRAMGLDPEVMKKQAEDFLSEMRGKAEEFDARLRAIEISLANEGRAEFEHIRKELAQLTVDADALTAEEASVNPPPTLRIDGE